MARISAYKNPHYLENLPLEFDNYSTEDTMSLTVEEKQERFMSKYLHVIRPFSQYAEYYPAVQTQPQVFLKMVKNFYKTYVIGEKWSEEKYVKVIDHLCVKYYKLSHKSIVKYGEVYERGDLDIQLKERKVIKRGKKRL